MNSSDFITGPPATSTVAEHTLYARDANGEVMAIYKGSNTEANRYNMTCSEWYIYGSKSHGRFARSQEPPYNTTMPVYDPALLYNAGSPPIHTRRLKYKDYEIKDHLGNVTTLFSDLKLPAGTPPSYFKIDLMEANNFYPFGMSESGLHYKAPSFNYRYSYNGMEKDDAIKGEGNSYDYGARFFDPRLGRFLSLDPHMKVYPNISPYSIVLNNPNKWNDHDGCLVQDEHGNIVYTVDNPNSEYIQYQDQIENNKYYTLYFKAEKGRILTDKGNEVVVYKATSRDIYLRVQQVTSDINGNKVLETITDGVYRGEGDYENSYNCTGNAFTNQNFTIGSSNINTQYLIDEGFELKLAISSAELLNNDNVFIQGNIGEIGMYYDKTQNYYTHFEPFLSPSTVSTKGGIVMDMGPSKPGANIHFNKGASYSIFQKNNQSTQIFPKSFIGPLNLNQIYGDIEIENTVNKINSVSNEVFESIQKNIQR
jgi:RHS repeat-associated protein